MRACRLDERLSAIAELVPECSAVADIGADHGFLGAHLLLTGKCACVQFVDISGESLMKARRLIRKLRLSDQAEFHVGDGAAALNGSVDAAVIAGMGAETIVGILDRGREKLGDAALVLAPNLGAPMIRRYLMENGYRIEDERLIAKERRFYPLISARRGHARYQETELLAGPVLLRDRPKEMGTYIDHRLHIARKALLGAEQGGEIWANSLKDEIRLWEEVRHDLGQAGT